MDTARLAEMMRATLSEDKTERDAAEEQLKQVKQHTHTMCFRWKCKNLFTGFSYLNRQNCFRSVHYKNKHRRNVHLSGYVFLFIYSIFIFFSLWVCECVGHRMCLNEFQHTSRNHLCWACGMCHCEKWRTAAA